MRGFNILVLMFGLTASSAAVGQELVIFAKAQPARGLQGVVLDPSGGLVDGAKVSLVTCPVTQPYPATRPAARFEVTTDARGMFKFDSSTFAGPYCLRVFREGFNVVEMQLKISRAAKELRITLPIAA